MATRYATKSGNWSDVTVWDGGVALPGVNDDVCTNTFTVTIDQSVTVLSLRNTALGAAAAGGTFNVTTGGYTITATVAGLVTGTVALMTISHNTLTTTIVATGTGITGGSAAAAYAISITGTGTVAITGNVTGGSNGTGYGVRVNAAATLTVSGVVAAGSSRGIRTDAASTVTITGNVTGYSTDSVACIELNAATALSITGTLTGGGGNNRRAVLCSAGASTIIVVGSLIGGTYQNTTAALDLGGTGSSVTVTGPVTGDQCRAIDGSGSPTVTITGNVTAPSANNAAITLTGAATLTVTGTLTAGTSLPAVSSTAASATNTFTGPFISASSGQLPFYCARAQISPIANNYYRFVKSTGGTIDLVSTDTVAGLPAQADVRYGTSYGAGTRAGTCRIPSAADVAIGVAVDNTVGTANLNPQAFWDLAVTAADDTAGSMGQRLAGAATASALGAVFAAVQGQD